MWAAIAAARHSVQLEIYIWKPGRIGDRFRELLVGAAGRGVRVQLLLDTFGAGGLPADYFAALLHAGGQLCWFNPKLLLRLSFRDHRKLQICDGQVAVVTGINIADEYDGDGIECGWRDFALEVRGPVVDDLSASFARMLSLASFGPSAMRRFARSRARERGAGDAETLLVSGPGLRTANLPRTLRNDLRHARDITAYAAYLVPTARVRRALRSAARHGTVRIITGAHSDVPLVQWAAERLYPSWLRSGAQLYEYQPQVMHAKLIVIDDIVYIGSANLDVRSLRINYELLLRIRSPPLAAQVRATMEADIARSRRIELKPWRDARSWWHPLRSWWAYFLLVRVDPYIARSKLRRLS